MIDLSKKYIWIKGDTFSEVEEIDFETEEMVFFKSRRNIFKNIFLEFLEEASEEVVYAARNSNPYTPYVMESSNVPNLHIENNSPVLLFLKKIKEKSIVGRDLTINVTIPLPNDRVLELLKESFEEIQISEGLQLYLSDFLSKMDFKDILKKKIDELFKEILEK